MRLHDFRVLTFDCYGTLIDWENGLLAALQPLLRSLSAAPARDALLAAFGRLEAVQEAATPRLIYADLLAEVHRSLAHELGAEVGEDDHRRFGASVADWPAFADSPAALAYLKEHFKLVILSNVDRRSFAASAKRLGVDFDAVYTAEEIGSYKPDPANFDYMLARLEAEGHGRAEILHTAQSLFHDHVPAKRLGLATAWIDRRHDKAGFGATPAPDEEIATDFRFPSLAAMAAAHRGEGVV
jgi:2-haloalkanoic acid dehalogenase type II